MAKSFEYVNGKTREDHITWTILADNEEIVEDTMQHTDHRISLLKVNIPWHPDKSILDYNKNFFDHFFPSLKGKSKLMDEYFSNDRCSMLCVIRKDGVKFHHLNNPDPDFLVKVCVTLDIAVALEGIILWSEILSNFFTANE